MLLLTDLIAVLISKNNCIKKSYCCATHCSYSYDQETQPFKKTITVYRAEFIFKKKKPELYHRKKC